MVFDVTFEFYQKMQFFYYIFIILPLALSSALAEGRDVSPKVSANVGMEGVVNVDISGGPVDVRHRGALGETDKEQRSEIHVFITNTSSKDNTTHYEIHFIGEVPGEYDLANFLERVEYNAFDRSVAKLTAKLSDDKDFSKTDSLKVKKLKIPSIPVTITSVLPADHNGALIPASTQPYRLITSYKEWMIFICVLWALSLIPLLLWGRKRKMEEEVAPEEPAPSLDEILQPLLDEAQNNTLDDAGKARLEKAVFLQLYRYLLNLEHNKDNLSHLETNSPYEMLQALKNHSSTQEAVDVLERWLHRPQTFQESNHSLKLSEEDIQTLRNALLQKQEEEDSLTTPTDSH
jgi:hypothetical protein